LRNYGVSLHSYGVLAERSSNLLVARFFPPTACFQRMNKIERALNMPQIVEKWLDVTGPVELPGRREVLAPGQYKLTMTVDEESVSGATVVLSGDLTRPEDDFTIPLQQEDLSILAFDRNVRTMSSA
jgi:hypothetical protein